MKPYHFNEVLAPTLTWCDCYNNATDENCADAIDRFENELQLCKLSMIKANYRETLIEISSTHWQELIHVLSDSPAKLCYLCELMDRYDELLNYIRVNVNSKTWHKLR